MTFTPEFFAFLTYTAMVMVFYCKADRYPPLTRLSYEWLDGFTVNVSWEKPEGLPEDSEIKFLVKRNTTDAGNMMYREYVPGSCRNVTHSFLTEEMGSDHWTYTIWTVSQCNTSTESTPVTITVRTLKPRAEVVKDFKCFISNDSNQTKCSWIPENKFLNLMLSYRICGRSEESIKSLKKCDQPYSTGERNNCNLLIDTTPDNIWILVENETVMSTFKPVLVALPPQLRIREERDYLNLSWTPPAIGLNCWTHEICHKQCNKPQGCKNTSNGESVMRVPYDKSCLYEFQSRVMASKYCIESPKFSDYSEVVTYGTNAPPDGTLTVVAIVIPIILSVCVILSCYCFRRHRAIICPVIPDPSVIFKEMMMNGNKELKTTTGNLYTPVPEPTERCNITIANENSVFPQNS